MFGVVPLTRLGVATLGGGATKIINKIIHLKLISVRSWNSHNGGGLVGGAFMDILVVPLVKLPLENNCCPCDFGGSKPNKSLEILLPLLMPLLIMSASSALGSKSLSESEFNSNPSSFVPTDGFSESIGFDI